MSSPAAVFINNVDVSGSVDISGSVDVSKKIVLNDSGNLKIHNFEISNIPSSTINHALSVNTTNNTLEWIDSSTILSSSDTGSIRLSTDPSSNFYERATTSVTTNNRTTSSPDFYDSLLTTLGINT